MIAGGYLHVVWKASFTKFGKSRPRKDCFLRAIKTFKKINSIAILNVCWTELNHNLMHSFQDSIFITKLNLESHTCPIAQHRRRRQLCIIRELSPIKMSENHYPKVKSCFLFTALLRPKQAQALSPDLDPPKIITLLPKHRPEVLWCMCFLYSISL